MSHFDSLLEQSIARFENNGIGRHDYVKITNPSVKGVNGDYTEIIKNLQKSDLNLRVLDFNGDETDGRSVTIGQEAAGGIYINKATIPVANLELVSRGYPPSIPESWIGNTDKEVEDLKPKPATDLISNKG
jgi:hypothetical protein